jgi:Tol biopolymer transport system component
MRTAVWLTTPAAGAPARKITAGRSDGQGGIAVADDGTIFYSASDKNEIDLYRLEPGGTPRRLTSGGGWSSANPSLSPDGRYLLFGRFREREALLARMNAHDGGDVRTLCPIVPGGRNAQRIAVTRDSRWVIFTSGRGGVERLWKVSIDGGEPVRISDFEASHPSISPDDQQIAFSGAFIGVMPMQGGAPRRVPNTHAISTSMAQWMPDGKTLLHSAGQNDRANLWLQPLDGSPPRKITNFDTEHIWRFDLSPNGQHLGIVRGLLERDAVLITDF